jgi:tetratricopeptide (TPR) repeat protein
MRSTYGPRIIRNREHLRVVFLDRCLLHMDGRIMLRRLLLKIAGLGMAAWTIAKPSFGDTFAANESTLDLKENAPDQFMGKTVMVESCKYVIGPRIRETEQGYAHRLINQRSRLSLHTIQIRREYLQSPDAAKQASLAKAAANMQMLNKMKASGSTVALSFLTVREAPGGVFEMHEFATGSSAFPGQAPPDAADPAIGAARGLMSRADFTGAASQLNQVVAAYPNHTIALNELAACHSALNNHVKAYELSSRVVEIEPNLAFYRAAQIDTALRMARRAVGITLFSELKRRYPDLAYFDSLGVRSFLAVGDAEKSSELFSRKTLSPTEVAALQPVVESAVNATAKYIELERRRDASLTKHSAPPAPVIADEELQRLLEETNSKFPTSPFIQANLGATLRRREDYKRAAQYFFAASGGLPDKLVPYCWSNAAFCLIPVADWPPAMNMLTATMNALPRGANGHVAPADVPGIVSWIYRSNTVTETVDPPAAALVERAISDCPDKTLVTPEIREMAMLLRQFYNSAKAARSPS